MLLIAEQKASSRAQVRFAPQRLEPLLLLDTALWVLQAIGIQCAAQSCLVVIRRHAAMTTRVCARLVNQRPFGDSSRNLPLNDSM